MATVCSKFKCFYNKALNFEGFSVSLIIHNCLYFWIKDKELSIFCFKEINADSSFPSRPETKTAWQQCLNTVPVKPVLEYSLAGQNGVKPMYVRAKFLNLILS